MVGVTALENPEDGDGSLATEGRLGSFLDGAAEAGERPRERLVPPTGASEGPLLSFVNGWKAQEGSWIARGRHRVLRNKVRGSLPVPRGRLMPSSSLAFEQETQAKPGNGPVTGCLIINHDWDVQMLVVNSTLPSGT